MAKLTINVGATANDRQGDSLRGAFQKINANFSELYTALGLNSDTTLNLGAFQFTGSVMDTTDSSAITIDQAVTVSSNLTVGGDILPSSDLGANLGSSTNRFKDLFLSGNTIAIGDQTISATSTGISTSGNLSIGAVTISAVGNSLNIPGISELRFKPYTLEDLRSLNGASFFNSDTTVANSVIVDRLTYLIATDATYAPLKSVGYIPSSYIATFDGSGNITAVAVNIPRFYPEEPGFTTLETINTDLIALDPDTDINDWDSIASSGQAVTLYVGINSESQPYSPAAASLSFYDLTTTPTTLAGYGITDAFDGAYSSLSGAPEIPTDVGELTDIGGLLSGGSGDGVVEGSTYKIDIAGDDSTLLVDGTNSKINLNGTILDGLVGIDTENLRVESGKISLNSSQTALSLATYADSEYTSASWSGNNIDFTAVEDIYLETLLGRFESHFDGSGLPWNAGYSNITVRINDTQTLTVTGASFSGGTNWRVTVAETPASDPTAVTTAEFFYDFVSTLKLDRDDNSYAIALDDSNFRINTRRDIRLESGDDVYIDGRSNMRLRNYSRTSGITIETDFNNSAYEWLFDEVGTLTTPGDIIVAGDITGTSGASTLYLKAEPSSNTYIQLNDTVDSTINTVANLEIRTDVAGTAKTWTFGTDGDLTLPEGGEILNSSGSSILSGYQTTLVSGTSIKTINSTSLLGSGNVTVQPTLVSGTNIKTLNNSSLLGSGNIDIEAYSDDKVNLLLGTDPTLGGVTTGYILSYDNSEPIQKYQWIPQSGGGGGPAIVLTTTATSVDQVVDLYGYKSAKISGYWTEDTVMAPSFGFYRDAETTLTASNGWGIYSRSPSSDWTQTVYNPPNTSYLYMGMNNDTTQGWFEIIIDGIGTDTLIFNTHTKTNSTALKDNWWTGVYSTDTLNCRYFKFQSNVYRYVTIVGYQ